MDTLIMHRVPDFTLNKCENFKKLIHGYLKNLRKFITQYVDLIDFGQDCGQIL